MYDSSNGSFAEGYAVGRDSNGGSNSNGGGMWGDNGWWIVIILFAMIWGWGGNGFGNGGGGATNAFLPYAIGGNGALTRGDLCNEFSFNDLQNGVRNINDSVNLGFANLNSTICHQQYDTAMQTNAIQAAVNGGFSALNSTICQQQYDTAGLINGVNNTIQGGFNAANIVALQNQNALQSQIASCCCDERAAIENLRFTIAQEDCNTRNLIQSTTRDMIDNNNANTRAILEKLTAQEIAAKDAQIAAQNQKLFAAELAASQSAQNAYLINTLRPTPVPAYPASSPCGYNWNPSVLAGYGYGNGSCGCGL